MEAMKNAELVEAIVTKGGEFARLLQEAARRTGRAEHELVVEFCQECLSGAPLEAHKHTLLAYLNIQHPQTQ